MIEQINEAIRAWRVYESSVCWAATDGSGDHPNMASDEFYAVWCAMEALDAAIEQEKANPGSTFADSIPAGARAKVYGMALRASVAYRAFKDAGYPKNERWGTFVPYEPYARKVSEAFEVPFVGGSDDES